jgi:hypothetical protein
MKRVISGGLVALLVSGIAAGQVNNMPSELVAFAAKNGCSQVDDFFGARPGMVSPPYVYGYLPGPKENSAAFWCQKKEGDERRFFLLIMHRRAPAEYPSDLKDVEHELARCPNKLEWTNYPGGLDVYKDRRTTLADFVYVKNPRRRPPSNIKLTNNAILSAYDGVEELFYCYKGDWLMRFRH